MSAAKTLPETTFAEIVQQKQLGNKLFSAGRYHQALDRWNAALDAYEGQTGDEAQAKEQVKLHSNKAEVYIKLERFEEARDACDTALSIDAADYKARFRRARACLAIGGPTELTQAMEDIKVIQANGGKIGEREAALLKSPTGALLPSLAAAACAGKGGVGGLAGKGTGEEDEEGEAQAREMAAAAVLAVGPELEAAMADAAAAQSIGSARRQAPEDTEIPQETPHESARVGKGPQRGNDAESGSNSPRGSARRQVVVRTEWQALLNGRTALQHCWLVDCYRTRVDAEYRSGRPPASQRVGAEAQTVPQFSSPQISSP